MASSNSWSLPSREGRSKIPPKIGDPGLQFGESIELLGGHGLMGPFMALVMQKRGRLCGRPLRNP
jgi:hypothetical protein